MEPENDTIQEMSKKHKGAMSELIASAFLLQHGYEVFRNVSQHGLADIIAWKQGERPIFIDVKTVTEIRVKSGISATISKLTPEQERCGVVPFHVFPDGGIAFLKYGRELPTRPEKTPPGPCSIDGCSHPVRARGYCKLHYMRHWAASRCVAA